MTILAVVKTGTDLVIAADSKVTTMGISGIDQSGQPKFVSQTYDYGTKIFFSKGNRWTIAISGQGSFGDVNISDLILEYPMAIFANNSDQEKDLDELVNKLNEIRNLKFSNYPFGFWPYTSLLAFSSNVEGRNVRAWNIIFEPDSITPKKVEILSVPGVYLDGSYREVFTMLYGYNSEVIDEIATSIGQKIEIIPMIAKKYLTPINKLNMQVMPLQDAMDFAVFLAQTQIQMERFLPGEARCGGPIDVAVVCGFPKNDIIWYPGKKLHHPGLA